MKDLYTVCGMTRDEWAERGIVLSPPSAEPGLTAEDAERIAMGRSRGASDAVACLVHVEIPTSRVFPTSDYWVVAAIPHPGAVSSGPALPTPRRHRAFVHMVVFVDATTGRVPMTQMWG